MSNQPGAWTQPRPRARGQCHPVSRTPSRREAGESEFRLQMEAAFCPELLSFCSKVTIGIIFLQNDSCHDNQSKFSFSETDVSFS